jgi:hypothetical protein
MRVISAHAQTKEKGSDIAVPMNIAVTAVSGSFQAVRSLVVIQETVLAALPWLHGKYTSLCKFIWR